MVRDDLAALNIHHAVFTSEKALHDSGAVQGAFDRLKQRGLIYTGVLEPPNGKPPADYEARPQELVKASESGDDRSEERRVGKESVRTCKSRGSPYLKKK